MDDVTKSTNGKGNSAVLITQQERDIFGSNLDDKGRGGR